jgi:hypothetical protein
MATPAETVKNNMTNTPDLSPYGIQNTAEIVYNPDYETLFAAETADNLAGFEIGKLTESGAIAVDTGDFTGRSPKDKYLVRDDTTRDTIWWADQGENDNKPIDTGTWNSLRSLVTEQLSGKKLFVVDTFCGANPDTFRYQHVHPPERRRTVGIRTGLCRAERFQDHQSRLPGDGFEFGEFRCLQHDRAHADHRRHLVRR